MNSNKLKIVVFFFLTFTVCIKLTGTKYNEKLPKIIFIIKITLNFKKRKMKRDYWNTNFFVKLINNHKTNLNGAILVNLSLFETFVIGHHFKI